MAESDKPSQLNEDGSRINFRPLAEGKKPDAADFRGPGNTTTAGDSIEFRSPTRAGGDSFGSELLFPQFSTGPCPKTGKERR